jgi:hypothetical protein
MILRKLWILSSGLVKISQTDTLSITKNIYNMPIAEVGKTERFETYSDIECRLIGLLFQ